MVRQLAVHSELNEVLKPLILHQPFVQFDVRVLRQPQDYKKVLFESPPMPPHVRDHPFCIELQKPGTSRDRDVEHHGTLQVGLGCWDLIGLFEVLLLFHEEVDDEVVEQI